MAPNPGRKILINRGLGLVILKDYWRILGITGGSLRRRNEMAQPIRATPSLTGEEAIQFLEKMKKTGNKAISKTDKALLDIIRENQKHFQI